MEDFDIAGKVEIAIGALAAAGAWMLGRLVWWQAIPNKFVKAAIAIGLFLAVAISLSLITALFT